MCWVSNQAAAGHVVSVATVILLQMATGREVGISHTERSIMPGRENGIRQTVARQHVAQQVAWTESAHSEKVNGMRARI